MWKDNDFKELFVNYSPTPPRQVWRNVALVLQKSQQPERYTYFNYSQRITLMVAGISSILLCGIMFCFTKESPRLYTERLEYNPLPKQSVIDNHFLLAESTIQQASVVSSSIAKMNGLKIVPKKMYSKPLLKLSDELKPFESELMALADLDRQIAKLGEEIVRLKTGEVVSENWKSPALTKTLTQTEFKVNANWEKFRNQLPLEQMAKDDEPKPLTDGNQQIADRFYITPYMGANYTLVFYQDKPANNFFSDKAMFSGQIGYNTGVQFGYQLSKRWSIESGLGIGQYIVGFKEDYGTYFRDGDMYIDQLDIPLSARYSFDFNKRKLPLSLAFKGGLIYSNVIFYQVNYTDKFTRIMSVNGNKEEHYKFDVDKSEYNSTQLGFALGFDFDAYFSKKISLNFSMLNAMVSQINNFPLFSAEKHRPIQFSSSLSIGTKIRF